MNQAISLNDTIISVVRNSQVIFQYDYMLLFNQWQKELRGITFDKHLDEKGDSEPEGYYISIDGDELRIGLTVCSDQAGVLGIVNVTTGELIHMEEGSYYQTCVTNDEVVVSLLLIHHWGVLPHFVLKRSPKGTLDIHYEGETMDLPDDIRLSFNDQHVMKYQGQDLYIDEHKIQITEM